MPADKIEVVKVATPLPFKVCGDPMFVPSALNCTVPVGVPAAEVTVAVKVTLWLKFEGLTEEDTAVVVAAGVLVKANEAVGRPVPIPATTLYDPAIPLAVKVGAVATPLPSVLTVADELKVPLAPLPGAVKVTGIPLWVTPDSLTLAFSAVPNALLIVALCGVPAVAVIV